MPDNSTEWWSCATVNCQSYWLSLESDRVSSSQAHSSLSSVTVEKQIGVIKLRVLADDRCFAGWKQKRSPFKLTQNSLKKKKKNIYNVCHQADDDQFQGQALRFFKCVAGCLATSQHLVSVHQQVYTLKCTCSHSMIRPDKTAVPSEKTENITAKKRQEEMI